MRAKCWLQLEYGTEEEAERMLRSVNVDDEGYISTKRAKTTLLVDSEASSLDSLMHTLNDYLACLSAAEKLR
ncbi:MAG: KEOPS complex subunit Pcc1 [Candidatus Thermoplasmatota archaeon]|nr:KEOPS complex subunit Pcc1 [Candidatus Thermoplasmatota archaeon]